MKCPRCEAKEETFIHGLKDCPSARAILTFGGLDNRLIEGNYSWCIDWLEDILREDDARGVWERAKNLSQDFRIHNLVYMPVIPAASIHEDGFAIGGSGGYKDCSLQAEWAEMVAFKESVKVAIRLKMSNILFESDCANLVNKINNRGKGFTILGSHIKVVFTQLDNFESVNVVWSHRSSNTVADFICNLAIQNKCNRCFGMNYVEDIHQRVIFDAIN
ncbi:hypothetical protein Goklo_000133 [Gossypium klotzschianum]|uniref:RNase H type-1 domain-containing protein n=1 Tax=Gossypium klotzschianum TaxID=34286 RepID=A0A7J8W3L8_9ROSI|nr:hypothetical protein [Gossypium klotzschianum]